MENPPDKKATMGNAALIKDQANQALAARTYLAVQ
jgi:hypothetical protein